MRTRLQSLRSRVLGSTLVLVLIANLVSRGTAAPPLGQLSYAARVATSEAVNALLTSNGTMLPPASGVGAMALGNNLPVPENKTATISLWTDLPSLPSGPATSWPSDLQAELRAQLDFIDPRLHTSLDIRFTDVAGAPLKGASPVKLTGEQGYKLKQELRHSPRLPRDGGLVYLAGGQFRFRNDANVLADTQLDTCGGKYCLRFSDPTQNPNGTGATVDLPFQPNSLFTAVWNRAYQGKDAFYLSINPKQSYLTGSSSTDIPTSKLEFYDNDSDKAANEIVTAGDVDKSEIGAILLAADVAFKSADLGFDVTSGKPIAQPIDDELPDPFDPRAATSRWCRYAWQSADQRMELTPRGVSFTSASIRAESEPMHLVAGKLKPAPSGGWCAKSKALAERLNAQVLRGNAPTAVMRLAEVANIQNFAFFARTNRLALTPNFQASLLNHPEKPQPKLPKWTSGIRSKIQPAIRLDYREFPPDGEPLRVLLAYGDLTPAQLARLNVEQESIARASRITNPDIPTDTQKHSSAIVEQRLEALVEKLAKDFGARKLSPLGPKAPVTDRFRFGIAPAPSPVIIHGGVLLGRLTSAKAKALLNSSIVRPDTGAPIFRATGAGSLHFWSTPWKTRAGESTGAEEHIEIRGGTLVGRYADEGKLRFVIQGKQVNARHEARFTKSAKYPQGLEWIQSIAHQGAPANVGVVAWKTDGGSEVKASTYDDLLHSLQLPIQDLRLRMAVIDTLAGLWLIEIQVPLYPIRERLDEHFRHARDDKDITKLNSAIADASLWGAHEDAKRWYEASRELISRDSADTLLEMQLSQNQMFTEFLVLTAAVQLAKLSELTSIKSQDQIRAGLDLITRIAQAMPPPLEFELENQAVKVLDKLAVSPQSPGVTKLITAQRGDHIRRKQISQALLGLTP